MPFYTFDQNNSGGSFVFEKDKLSKYVVIEAQSPKVAKALAEDLGIYFDGCENGRDCECCGDRWYEPWLEAGDILPTINGQDVTDGVLNTCYTTWMAPNPEGYIHYLDGRIVPVFVTIGEEG